MAEGQVYATLLLTDQYLPGALVLAHSLRDAGTTKKLAVLYTSDTVSVEVVAELNSVFDYVISVERVLNDNPQNLHLMGRPDLHSAFTKIQLWKQTQFSKIVYLDADVVGLRAPDELFDLEAPFSAAPDIGWPDLFNTGVMVLTPNMEDYNAMKSMADQGTSFDGADQGLINMHFKNNYNRISFSYNVTPSAHYQYMPAYEHFKKDISLVHFIGAGKPWSLGKSATSSGSGPYTELASKWWAVFDKHFSKNSSQTGAKDFHLAQYFVRGGFNPTGNEQVPGFFETGKPYNAMTWDAAHYPPPKSSRGEAVNLPYRTYPMSTDTSSFVPPRNLWYNAPNEQPPQQVFPWEARQPKPLRSFAEEERLNEPQAQPSSPTAMTTTTATSDPGSGPTTPTALDGPSTDTWDAYTRTNAWDDVPDIDRYVSGLQTTRGDQKAQIASPMAVRPDFGGVQEEEEGVAAGETSLQMRGSGGPAAEVGHAARGAYA